nr:LytTR family transcriptional regulator DNA-binding domain-containing protein [uncultured Lachnoclostridium sp.]
MNIINVVLILALIIEPVIWIHAVCLKFERKFQRLWPYASYILLDILISCINDFTKVNKIIGDLFFTLLFMVYMILFVCFAFKEKLYMKILYAGILIILSLVSDIIVFIIFSLFGLNTQQMSEYGIYNAMATLISKIVLYILIIILNRRKFSLNKSTIGIIGLLSITELPSVVLFKNSEKVSNLFLITYMVSQIAVVLLIMYFKRVIMAKKYQADKAVARVSELEEQTQKAIARAAELEVQTEEAAARLIELERQTKEARTKAIELEKQLNDRSEMIEIIENRKKVLISIEDIMYAEKVDRKVTIKTKNNLYRVNKSITYLEEQLGESFLRINQGTLVNKEYIERAGGSSLCMKNGETFHIPRERTKDVKDSLRKEMM